MNTRSEGVQFGWSVSNGNNPFNDSNDDVLHQVSTPEEDSAESKIRENKVLMNPI